MKHQWKKWFVGLAVLIGVVYLLYLFNVLSLLGFFQSPTRLAMERKQAKEKRVMDALHFALKDPGEAPQALHEQVTLGYQLMLHTPQYAEAYVGDQLSCTHCHFAGGNTSGGTNNGFALAGVSATYPKYEPRLKEMIDLPKRINLCFERSMNGKALPLDSKEMLALVTYLQWISKGVPTYTDVPWLGIPPLVSTHKADSQNGKQVYVKSCALCHGVNGEGEFENDIPPLWGDKSFNDAAGMNKLETLAAFIYWNMPYDDIGLTVEDSIDVAQYIIEQTRPHYKKDTNAK